MRNSFLALVLANLAFAAWHYGVSQPPQPLPRAREVATIVLASEIEAEARSAAVTPAERDLGEPDIAETVDDTSSPPEAAPEALPGEEAQAVAADAAPVAAIEHCVSVGPFHELSQAAGAAGTLRERGYQPSQRASEGDIWVGYWVYLDGIPTQAEANGIVARLRENAITDAYVIPDSDSGNLVSLGVFTEIARAGARREATRALGFEPLIVDRSTRGTVYWVDVNLQNQESLDFELLQTPGRIVRLEQRACVD